ncbi:MAG TPA: transposase [Gaiellaceae bacterium]|nr:transposase [Gaiellaceae bacterium]
MTRQRDTAAGLFHVTCHSVWDGTLYRDDLDRANYVHWVARSCSENAVVCIGSCILTTHVHLILEVEAMRLPAVMYDLNFRYASRFNSRHRRRGRVFGSPYGASRINDDGHLLTVYRYLARNPIEAGLVGKPQDWAWSSYGAAVGASDGFEFVNPQRVLEILGGAREVAVARLRRFVEGA